MFALLISLCWKHFGLGAEAQAAETHVDGPSRSPAGKGQIPHAVLQESSPLRGGKDCALGDNG